MGWKGITITWRKITVKPHISILLALSSFTYDISLLICHIHNIPKLQVWQYLIIQSLFQRTSAFTLLYDTMSYKIFHMTLYQYDIHIIVLRKNILYDKHLNFVRSRGWICVVSVKIGHCTHCSHDLNDWQVASVRSAPVILLSPAQLYESCMELTFTWGEGSCTGELSFKTIIVSLYSASQ